MNKTYLYPVIPSQGPAIIPSQPPAIIPSQPPANQTLKQIVSYVYNIRNVNRIRTYNHHIDTVRVRLVREFLLLWETLSCTSVHPKTKIQQQ